MEYYSAIKRNEIGPFVEAWMDLDIVIQDEVRQTEKNKYHNSIYVESTKMTLLIYVKPSTKKV